MSNKEEVGTGKTKIMLSMPKEAAARLRAKFEKDPEAFKAHFKAGGFDIVGVRIHDAKKSARDELNSQAYSDVCDRNPPKFPDNEEYMAMYNGWKNLLPERERLEF